MFLNLMILFIRNFFSVSHSDTFGGNSEARLFSLKNCIFLTPLIFPGLQKLSGKELSACMEMQFNSSGRSSGEGNINPLCSIISWEILHSGRYSPCGSQKSWTDVAAKWNNNRIVLPGLLEPSSVSLCSANPMKCFRIDCHLGDTALFYVKPDCHASLTLTIPHI